MNIIDNIGFDYPSDFTLRPQSKLPQIIKISALSGLKRVGITSYGRGYNHPPTLVVLDGLTRQKDNDKFKNAVREINNLKHELREIKTLIKEIVKK